MEKIVAAILLVVTMGFSTACGATPSIEGEESAVNVYTCSSNNMFGLEKIALFEDRVVAVFDKRKSESFKYDQLKDALDSEKQVVYASANNIERCLSGENSVELVNGKYIVTVHFRYEDSDVKDPNEPVVGCGLSVLGRRVTVMNDGHIHIEYGLSGGECETVFSQDYDLETKKWSKQEETDYYFPMISE